MTSEFKDLFAYNHDCNQRLISAIADPTLLSQKATELLNHIINAHQIWNARITGGETFGVWQINEWEKLVELDQENYKTTLAILNEGDLSDLMDYTTSKGDWFTNTIRDTLFHVINHSTYHRAQIATEMKLSGMSPLSTDYIFYKRKLV
jgi:uncharacterized damage-inducible protein DinB